MTDLTSALKAIEVRLSEYKSKTKAATLVVLQTSLNNLASMGVPTLSNDFPVIKCPTVLGDNEYPALDWLRFAISNMTKRFTEVPIWL